MHAPEEALAELEHATGLGLDAFMFGGPILRPTPGVDHRAARWLDTLGVDSLYDYDPLWKKCVELKIAPTFHTGSSRMALRNSAVNFTFNHIGHFAESGHAAAKGIFLGGVTRRFPELRFAFLEGGVGWGCQLFVDLIEHWEKRNRKALEHMNPRTLDRSLLQEMAQKYGYEEHIAALKARDGWPDPDAYELTGGVADLDDFSACQITKKQDWQDLFVTPFYFGCEADDRMNACAFNQRANPFSARLNAVLGSDIGHFDVPDMMDVIPEAYELVDDGVITPEDFRDFTFTNAVRLWGTQNPKFFEGTAVARAAAVVLAETKKATASV